MRASSALQGDCDTGKEGVWSNDFYNPARLAFFDRWLKKQPRLDEIEPVSVFVMGTGIGGLTDTGNLNHGGKWRYANDWPIGPIRQKKLYFNSDGIFDDEIHKNSIDKLSYTFDPNDPVPTIGGPIVGMFEILKPNEGGPSLDFVPEHLDQWSFLKNYIREVLPAGGFHQKESNQSFLSSKSDKLLKDRKDVVTFETKPLSEKIEIIGVIKIELYVASEALDTDFTFKLIDVYPPFKNYTEGYHLNLTDTIFRMRYRYGYDKEEMMKKNEIYKINLDLWPVANVFKKGHKLRIDISSSNFPRFDINPNTGEPVGRHTKMLSTKNSIFMSKIYPSNINVPILNN